MLNRAVMFAPLICILIILPTATPVFGWTHFSTSGDWVECERYHFIRNGTGIAGTAEWNNTVANFSGYWFMLHNVTWENYREWWQFDTAHEFYIRVKIETCCGTVFVVTRLGGRTDIFGLMNTFHVSVGASSNVSTWDQVPLTIPSFSTYGWDVAGWNPEEFQLFIIPEGGQTRIVWLWTVGEKNIAYTTVLLFEIDPSAAVTLTYEHSGDGYAEGWVSDSFTLPSLPSYEDIKSGWIAWLSNALGIDLGAAIATLLAMVKLFFEVVKITLPLLGAIVFFWIMDTIFTAVTTGQVRLIGDMFLKIYDIIISIWRTLVNIIDTIWDLITFWS